jgi:hypothetical protein
MTGHFHRRVEKTLLANADTGAKKVPVTLDTAKDSLLDVKKRNKIWSDLDNTKGW